MKKSIILFLSLFFLHQLALFTGSVFSISGIEVWYPNLIKPDFNPPSYVFGPIWFLLYTIMTIAIYSVVTSKAEKKEKVRVLTIYGLHLALNVLWSLFFFGLESPALGFVDILIVLSSGIFVAYLFYKIRKVAAYLLIPYLVWLGFATVLNLSIWILN